MACSQKKHIDSVNLFLFHENKKLTGSLYLTNFAHDNFFCCGIKCSHFVCTQGVNRIQLVKVGSLASTIFLTHLNLGVSVSTNSSMHILVHINKPYSIKRL
jgi:hypothetical protein